MKITLTDQEHAYVLAGLRALQQAEPTLVDDLVQGYVADGGFPTLTDSGIDDLCERINTESEEVDVEKLPHDLPVREFTLNCYWQMHGHITVTAESYAEAVEKAHGADLPDGAYVPFSFEAFEVEGRAD